MKILILFLLIALLPTTLSAQDFCGKYVDLSGCHLQINTDSTFNFNWAFDLEHSWTNGKWRASHDTIYFTPILIYDTIPYTDAHTHLMMDSLILSTDDKANRNFDSFIIYASGNVVYYSAEMMGQTQNRYPITKKLYYKKDRLYSIRNGKLYKKKERELWTKKKCHPWYVRLRELNSTR